jgi:hypothetical protein
MQANEPFAAALRTALLAADRPSAAYPVHSCWLLDQSALPPLPWLKRALDGLPAIPVLQAQAQDIFDGATPLLVPLDPALQRTFTFAQQLHAVARFANAVCVLRSPMTLADLQRALQLRARVELPGQLSAVLRWFDTRTLTALPTLLGPAQYAALLQDIEAWWFVDRAGELQHMPAVAPDITPADLPLRLTQAQEQALIDDGLADAVIDLLITHNHPALQDSTPPEQYALVRPLAHTARERGLGEPPQALAFVIKALEQGADFYQREPWSAGLARFAAGTASWQQALA